MQESLSNIELPINQKLYKKNPLSSALGKRIIQESVVLIHSIGFEKFTINKLSKEVETTEASIYRYFESKHKILLYLTNWYWSWMDYKINISTINLKPIKQLEIAIELLISEVKEDNDFTIINEIKLNKIVVCESSKAFLTQEVDDDNEIGAYKSYKKLVSNISNIILEINPKYKYPNMLVTTVIEGAHNQRYFSEHLPLLTNKLKNEDSVSEFFKTMVLNLIKK